MANSADPDQKPTDLDLHCLQRQGISGFSRTRVNISLNMAHMLIFLLKKCECICKSYSHFFSKNICELDIVLTRTVNILTTKELFKLIML